MSYRKKITLAFIATALAAGTVGWFAKGHIERQKRPSGTQLRVELLQRLGVSLPLEEILGGAAYWDLIGKWYRNDDKAVIEFGGRTYRIAGEDSDLQPGETVLARRPSGIAGADIEVMLVEGPGQ